MSGALNLHLVMLYIYWDGLLQCVNVTGLRDLLDSKFKSIPFVLRPNASTISGAVSVPNCHFLQLQSQGLNVLEIFSDPCWCVCSANWHGYIDYNVRPVHRHFLFCFMSQIIVTSLFLGTIPASYIFCTGVWCHPSDFWHSKT